VETIRDRLQSAAPVRLSTQAALFTPHAITMTGGTMTGGQAIDLMRWTLAASAHDATTRMAHALLIVHLRHLLDVLRTIDSDHIAAGVIAAAQLLHGHLRQWLLNQPQLRIRGEGIPKGSRV